MNSKINFIYPCCETLIELEARNYPVTKGTRCVLVDGVISNNVLVIARGIAYVSDTKVMVAIANLSTTAKNS